MKKENENETNGMTFEELERLKEEKLEIDSSAFEVNEGSCKECNEKLIKIVENKSLFDGSMTFHIIKLKCIQCGHEYLDLEQAEKYDFFLTLEKASKSKQPIEILTRKVLA